MEGFLIQLVKYSKTFVNPNLTEPEEIPVRVL